MAGGATWTALTLLLALVVQGARSEASDEESRIHRATNYIKMYTAKHGIGMLNSDRDIKCVLEMGRAMRNDKEGRLNKSVTSAYQVLMRTSPTCKFAILSKGRMYLNADFLRNLVNILIWHTTTTPPASAQATSKSSNTKD